MSDSTVATAVGLIVLFSLSACNRIDTENATILEVSGVDVPMCPEGEIVIGSVPLSPSEPSGAGPRNAFNPFADDHKLPSGVVELDGANEGTYVFALSSADGRYYEEVYVVRDGLVTDGFGCGTGAAPFQQ